jgi:hypothetical protein
MNIRRLTYSRLLILSATLSVGLLFVSCSQETQEKTLIVTKVPASSFTTGEKSYIPSWEGAALVAVPVGKDHLPAVLTKDFYSACSPHVSYDGNHILFTGQKKKGDPWSIWEMDLRKRFSRQITKCKESCFTPYYLPGGRIVFTREMPDTGNGSFLTLFTMMLDGTMLRQIAYHPNNDLITTILNDGRILMLSRQVFPSAGEEKYLAFRPNGTKLELFYKGNNGTLSGRRVHETKAERLWFTERSPEGKWNILRIRYNRPLHSAVNCTKNIPGDFYSVLPCDSGTLVVSHKKTGSDQYDLITFSTKTKQPGETLLSEKGFHFIDPVLAAPYTRPRNLPDELMCSYPTGLLMSQNINFTNEEGRKMLNGRKAKYIEILGMDKSLGWIPVEKDGSFFLKIPANMPFRLQTLDEHKKVLLGPSDWMWMRPFERRGCIGCHENPELAPENVVPMAVNYFPVVVPVDTTKELQRGETFHLGKMH